MIRPHDLAIYPLPYIRRAAPSDIETIVAIENESFIDPWEPSVFFEAFYLFSNDLILLQSVMELLRDLSLAGSRTRVKISTGTCATLA